MKAKTICVVGRLLDQDDGLAVYGMNLLDHMFRQGSDLNFVLVLSSSRHAHRFAVFPNVKTIVRPIAVKLWWDQVTVLRVASHHRADIIFNPKFSIPLLSKAACAFVLQGTDWYVNPRNYPW